MRFALVAFLFCVACGGSGEQAYPTYQECFDDHVNVEALPVQEAIVICCLDHPIAGHTEVCGSTTADCMTYLSTNLSSSSATQTDVSAACMDYVTQKGM